MTTVAVLGTPANETNREFVAAWGVRGIGCDLIAPEQSLRCLQYDKVLARLDVLPTLDQLPTRAGYTVVELNGAVEFDAGYCVDGDIYATVAGALAITNEEQWPLRSATARPCRRGPVTVSSSAATA